MACLFVTTAFGLTGCGGGGSNNASGTNPANNAGTTAQTVSGVAATGSPLSGTVYLKDSSSPVKEISTPINADGSYSLDVTGLTTPFLLKAVGTANGQSYTLYSLAGAPGVANINPLSNLAIVQANNGADPTAIYANLTAAQVQAIRTGLVTAIPQIQALLQKILTPYGVATTNFISDGYTANHVGLDLLFDMVAITANSGSLVITNKVSGANILTTTVNGTTLSGTVVTSNIPTLTTQTVGAVNVFSVSTTVAAGGTTSFKAIVIGTTNQAVTWSVVETGGGTITSAGAYTAPTTAGTYHVTATSAADSSKSATATVTVSSSSVVTSNAVKSVLLSGMYATYNNSYSPGNNGTYVQIYATSRNGLAADGVTLSNINTYYDGASKTWTTSLPSGAPTDLFQQNNLSYVLTASGWVTNSNGTQGYSLAFNADGTATITTTIDGARSNIAITSTDISGQTISAMPSSWPAWPVAGVFPSGSIRYDMIWTNLNDEYTLDNGATVPAGTTLAQVPTFNGQISINAFTDCYAKFVAGSTTVDFYQYPTSGQTSQAVKIGSGSYGFTIVSGQQILEIIIPPALRTQYGLGGNPIYGVVNGVVWSGWHSVPGLDPSANDGSCNSVAISYIQGQLNSSVAKTVMTKAIRKSVLGRQVPLW